ncbi:MAG: AmmeMemoRadiSam system radical SAM enzyme [Spirochaetota bacterium]
MDQRCDFCWRMCRIREGEIGWCGVRANQGGELVTLGYGELVSVGVDPIEKKPMYHFLPGSRTLSVAMFGCNFRCASCQNSEISQPESRLSPQNEGSSRMKQFYSPEQLTAAMQSSKTRIMTYTYSDPIVWQDYMLDTATLVRQSGGLNCMVTNGSFSPSSLQRSLELIDGFNVDLKGNDSFYRTWCAGMLDPVMRSIETIAKTPGKVLEVTTLVIEGLHSTEDIAELGKRLLDAGVQVWHLSRFFPYYRMSDRKPTREQFLSACLETAADAGIPFVYGGNSANKDWDKTVCPQCGRQLFSSHSYGGEAAIQVEQSLQSGRCRACGAEIYGLFSSSR